MNYKIIDNFLNIKDFKNLNSFIKGKEIPWFFNKVDVANNIKNKNGFFQHTFYENHQPINNYITQINPFMEKLKIVGILRIRANLTTRDIDAVESSYHTDNDNLSSCTAIFFFNNCNSKTILKLPDEDMVVESKENRILIFKSSIYHKVVYATDIHKRYVINFNYFTEE